MSSGSSGGHTATRTSSTSGGTTLKTRSKIRPTTGSISSPSTQSVAACGGDRVKDSVGAASINQHVGDGVFVDDSDVMDTHQVATKRPWNGVLPKQKKKKKGLGRRQQKNSTTWIAYKESMMVADATATTSTGLSVDNQPCVADDEDEDDNNSIDITLTKPPSQLIRTIASRNNTIMRERTKRMAAEEKVAKLAAALKQSRHENYNDKKVSRDLINNATKEGVEMTVAARIMMDKSQATIDSASDLNCQLKDVFSQKVHAERQFWTKKITQCRNQHKSECAALEATISHRENKHEAEKIRITARFTKQTADMKRETEKEQSRAKQIEAEVESLRNALHEEKTRQRQRVQLIYDENAELRERNNMIGKLLNESTAELKAATKKKVAAEKKAAKANLLAAKRKEEVGELKLLNDELQDSLADESHLRCDLERENERNTATKLLEIKRGRAVGSHGGSDKWSDEVVLWIWEQLCNGTPPSAVPNNIQSAHCTLRNGPLKEVPQESFVREQRIPLQVANTILAAYKLGKAKCWTQLYTDGTSRRQLSFQNLIADVKYEDGSTDTVIVSSGIFAENNTAQVLMETIIDHIEGLKIPYQRWRDKVERDHPELLRHLPKVDSIGIHKLAKDSVIMTDTCNTARKLNRLLSGELSMNTGKNVHSLMCHHHLRNIHVKQILEAITKDLRESLQECMEKLDKRLRISPDFLAMARAIDREFSLCANYPKGHGARFLQWMKKHHPGELLLHVERAASGGRHDIVSMASLAIFWNRNYYIEFLHELLVFGGMGDNILVNCNYAMLSSLEMVAVARLWSILHISIIMQLRWIASMVHELPEYDWSYFNIGNVYDELKVNLEVIIDKPELIHDEKFMMGIMSKWVEELPPLKKYLHHEFEEKKTSYVDSSEESNTKAVPLKLVRQELFYPTDADNVECTSRLESLAKIACQTWIRELLDPKKATFQFMSESGSAFCWANCSPELKKAAKGKKAVNDLAESSFAGVTEQLQKFGRISIANAAGVSDMKRNKFLKRATTRKEIKEGISGILHQMPRELQLTLVAVSRELSSIRRKENNAALERQLQHKLRAEEIRKEEGMMKVRDEYISCLKYHRLWDSESCWKTAIEVEKGLEKISTKGGQLDSLKTNILIRYWGMRWTECYTTMSKDGKKKSVNELKARLIEIIEETKDKPIPDRLYPTKFGSAARTDKLPILGTVTEIVKHMNASSAAGDGDLDLQARIEWKEREENNVEDSMRFMMQQPGNRLTLDTSFVGKRIQILASFGEEESDDDDDDGNGDVVGDGNGDDNKSDHLHWCTGTIEEIYDDGKEALVLWEAIPKFGYPESRTVESFPAHKFKSKTLGGWILYKEVDYGLD